MTGLLNNGSGLMTRNGTLTQMTQRQLLKKKLATGEKISCKLDKLNLSH